MHYLAKILINESELNEIDNDHIRYLAEEELDNFYDYGKNTPTEFSVAG